jgi:hypothetical protein
MRGTSIVVPVIFGVICASGAAKELSIPATYTVSLQCSGPVRLSAAGVPEIYSWAIDLARSSQGNSEGPDWVFPISEVNQEYREALAGDYIRVDLTPLATITTLRGRVRVSAIVVRLDPSPNNWRPKYPDHFVDSLFTINEAGVVVGHALYSGQILSGLYGAIGKAISDPDACKREEKSFLRGLSAPPLPPPTVFSPAFGSLPGSGP